MSNSERINRIARCIAAAKEIPSAILQKAEAAVAKAREFGMNSNVLASFDILAPAKYSHSNGYGYHAGITVGRENRWGVVCTASSPSLSAMCNSARGNERALFASIDAAMEIAKQYTQVQGSWLALKKLVDELNALEAKLA